MKKNLAIWLGLMCMTQVALASTDSTLRFANAIYEDNVKSVRFVKTESGFNFPLYNLGSDKKLTLEFDQIKTERDFYQITLIHCDAYWRPTQGLVKTQYLEGQGYENIDDVGFSSGTLTNYTHYKVELPTENMMPKVSGNYILVVYRNFDEKDIVLSRRMMVLDIKGRIDMELFQSKQVDLRITHQQVNMTFVVNGDYYMPNPLQDIKTVVLRNGEWEYANFDMKPNVYFGQTFQYNQQLGNQFEGVNQYRFFDLRSLRMAMSGVSKRLNIANQKHVWLVQDKSRGMERYFNWADINGKVLYDNKDIPLPAGVILESDYCYVHFSLKAEREFENPVYIYGEISDWRVMESHKLYWNPDAMMYEAVLPLKQGYYNYLYGVLDPATQKLSFMELEGNHAETENNYMTLIYHKNPNMGYDELIAYGLKNTATALR